MKLKFDLDPSPKKAAVIALCIFIITFTTALQAITIGGNMPTHPQLITMLCGSVAAAVTYALGFLGYEHKKNGET